MFGVVLDEDCQWNVVGRISLVGMLEAEKSENSKQVAGQVTTTTLLTTLQTTVGPRSH